MVKIINDFVESRCTTCGYGFFEGNDSAVKFARTISKNERRQWAKYGKIPTAFKEYLARKFNFVPANDRGFTHRIDQGGSRKKKTDGIAEILEYLLDGHCQNLNSQQEIDLMAEQIFQDHFQAAHSLYKANADYIWCKIEQEFQFKMGRKNGK